MKCLLSLLLVVASCGVAEAHHFTRLFAPVAHVPVAVTPIVQVQPVTVATVAVAPVAVSPVAVAPVVASPCAGPRCGDYRATIATRLRWAIQDREARLSRIHAVALPALPVAHAVPLAPTLAAPECEKE